MKICKLQLQNFRNYDKYELEFDESKNLFVVLGGNGKGKTNILEAIYMLSTGKTFRTADQDNILKWGQDFFTTKGEVEIDNEKKSLEVSYSNYPRKQKIFKINDVPKKHSEYLGTFISVIFHPKDLNLIYLEPGLRRKYLNLLLAQTDKYYLESLSNYTRIIKQRNALLDEISDGNTSAAELDVWDEKISIEGSKLIHKRDEYIKFLNKKLPKIYREISGGKENVSVIHLRKTEGDTVDEITQSYIQKLRLKRDKDVRYGSTSVGPHRDDVQFILDEHPFEDSASRGEARTLIISLKIAEIAYIKKIRKTLPILLLDDVFSELDEERQSHLLNAVKDCQTFITAAEKSHVKEAQESAEIISI